MSSISPHFLRLIVTDYNLGTISDYNLIVSQLKDIVRRGHRIELHIHPHWVNAKYNNDGTWDFSDYSHYSLNSFSQEEIMQMFVEGLINQGISYQISQGIGFEDIGIEMNMMLCLSYII